MPVGGNKPAEMIQWSYHTNLMMAHVFVGQA